MKVTFLSDGSPLLLIIFGGCLWSSAEHTHREREIRLARISAGVGVDVAVCGPRRLFIDFFSPKVAPKVAGVGLADAGLSRKGPQTEQATTIITIIVVLSGALT